MKTWSWLLALVLVASVGCGGSSSGGEEAEVADVQQEEAAPEAVEIIIRECYKSEDCAAVLGEPDQCEKLYCEPVEGKCQKLPADAGTKCSDGDPCTRDDSCAVVEGAGVCQSGEDQCECRETADCAGKEDGDMCNGTLRCDVGDVPYHCVLDSSTIVYCSAKDDTVCQHNTCNQATGACEMVDAEAGTECDDGDICTGPDGCQQGQCQGADLGCQCQDDLDCKPLDDDDLCTGYMMCNKQALPYQCIVAPGSVVTCTPEDDTDCMRNTCNPAFGTCSMQPAQQGTTCDDGNFCTVNDACNQGLCVGGGAKDCEDGNPCTNDGCDPSKQKCFSVYNNAPCEDADKCHSGDTCKFGVCTPGTVPVDCGDGDKCTTEVCNPTVGCVYTPVACDDQNACTTDACNPANGACVHLPLLCDDQNLCTTESCDPASGCKYTPVGCDDQNACTEDGCEPQGGCTHSPAICVDGDACTTDGCDPLAGCQFQPLTCDDANLCTADSCDPLTGCLFDPIPCVDQDLCTLDSCDPASGCTFPAVVCDDQDACTSDACNPLDGKCEFTPLELTDNDACTADACDPATGDITHPAITCDDQLLCTIDTCDPATGCVFTPLACDDSNACTSDACNPDDGKCFFTPITCNDDSLCTLDSCDPATGCVFTPTVTCDDGDACTSDVCDPAQGLCLTTPITCDDADLCTTDSCDSATGCVFTPSVSCDDSNVCTTDACNPSDGQCTFSPITCQDDANPCTVPACDPVTGCYLANQQDGVACDDGDPDNWHDQCTTGVCAGEPVPYDAFRLRGLMVVSPVLCLDPGTGQCADVTQVVNYLLMQQFNDPVNPLHLLGVFHPADGSYDARWFRLEVGLCQVEGTTVTSCGPDPSVPPSNWSTPFMSGTEACMTSPMPINPACFSSHAETAQFRLLGMAFGMMNATMAATLTPDGNRLEPGALTGFVPRSYASTVGLSYGGTTYTLADMLAAQPLETYNGVEGWTMLFGFVADRIPAYVP